MPRDDAARKQIDEADDECARAGLTDRASRETEEKVTERGNVAVCDGRQRRCARDGVNDRGVSLRCQRAEGHEHEYARRDRGIDGIFANTAEKPLDDHDGEKRADDALPDRNVRGEIECEQESRDGGAEVADGLILFDGDLKECLEQHAAEHADTDDEKRAQTEDHRARHGDGNEGNEDVTHNARRGFSAVNVG